MAGRTVLEVVMAADPRSLEKGFKRGEKASDSFQKKTDRNNDLIGRSAGKMSKKLIAAGTAAVGAYASISGAKAAIATTETLAKTTLVLSKNLGMSVEEGSRWAAVAASRNIDTKALATSFGTLSKQASAASKQTGFSTSAFKKLGLSQKDVNSGNKDFTVLLSKTADGFAAMAPGAQRTALGMKLFGKGWQTVLPVLRGGSEAMREQLDLADKYGVTLKGKTVESVADLAAVQRENKFATMGLQVALGQYLVPAMLAVSGNTAKLVAGFREGTGVGGAVASVVVPAFEKVRDAVQSAVPVVEGVVQKFKQGDSTAITLAATLGGLVAGFAAFRIISSVTTSITALNVAMRANPAGLVVTAIAAVAAGLYIAYQKSDQFRAIVDKTWASVKAFYTELTRGQSVGTLLATGFDRVKTAISAAGAAISGFVTRNRQDFVNIGQAVSTVAHAIGDVFTGFVLPSLQRALPGIKAVISGVVTVLRGLVKIVDGIIHGDFSKVWDGVKTVVSGAIKAIPGAIRAGTAVAREAASQLGGKIVEALKSGASKAGELVSTIANGIRGRLGDLKDFFVRLGKDIVGAIAAGIRAAPGAIGKAIGNAAKGALSIVPGIGDGIGRKAKSAAMVVGKPSGSLGGANSALSPFARVGAGAGLHVSSGKRTSGGRTSSGGISYHGSGEAIDLANGRGPDAAKLAVFRTLKSKYGSRLAELIYTPGGVGIKDGQPFTYSGKVAKDHFDHVHVALDLGTPGPGIGSAVTGGRKDFVGDGPGRYSAAAYKTLWQRAGGPASSAVIAAAVGLAEGGGNPNATNRNDDGSIDRGLWQINSTHGAMSTFDPLGNARAAVKISKRGSDWSPWVAYTTGSYKRFVSAASSARAAAATSVTKAKASGKTVTTAKSTGASYGSSLTGAQAGYEKKYAAAAVQQGLVEADRSEQATKAADVWASGIQDQSDRAAAASAAAAKVITDRGALASSGLAMARFTASLADDVPAAFAVVTDAQWTYNDAVRDYGAASAEAQASLVALTQTQHDYNDVVREARLQPFREGVASLNDDLVRAQVDTPDDKTDDIAVVVGQLASATAGYADAAARGDEAAIIEFGTQVMGLRGDLKSLQDAVTENTSAVAQALTDLTASIDRQLAIADSTLAITAAQVARALGDMVSGEIGGSYLRGPAMTAGAGTTVRY